MEARELYEVLGLQPFADGAMVDQAYWHLAKSFQTLAVTDPRARLALDELNDAYGVLGTPRLREEYDLVLSARGGRAVVAAPKSGHTRTSQDAGTQGASKKSFRLHSLFKRKAVDKTAPAGEPSAPQVSAEAAAAALPRRQSMRRSSADVQHLQASTEEMLKRWRANAGIEAAAQTPDEDVQSLPDTTLVDIFRSESAVEDEQDPLNAVMDVLRASKDAVPARP